MKPEKGLYQDCSETDQPEGTYRYAKNITDSNLLGTKENEDGFRQFDLVVPYSRIGVIPVGEDFVVFSTDNTDSEIGLVTRAGNTLTYDQLYNDPDLNFSTEHPIQGEFRKDVTGDRIVAWTDDFNKPRIFNVDDQSDIDDVVDLEIFQEVANPTLSSSSVNDFGGSLLTGAYIPVTKYQNADGSETNWFVHDHVFYINDDSKSESFNTNDGAIPGTVSNKSITFTLTDSDLRYDTIVVGYIRVVDSIITAFEAYSRTNASTLTLSITGGEATTDITLDEILTPTTNYNTTATLTQLSGQLYFGNLTSSPLPLLQESALSILINYTHSKVNVISNIDSHKDNMPPAFMPGEVYAFYLGVELNNGGWAFYHVPGRVSTGNELDTVASEGLTYTRFQVEDTSDKGGATTNMGYWQNENEVYPTGAQFATVTGTKVRHHRFPTVDHLISQHYNSDSSIGITHLVRLGIEVSIVNIPVDIQPLIKRWKIFYAKKSTANSLVMGSDLLHSATNIETDSVIRWSSGGNWRTEAADIGDDWEDFLLPPYDNIRGHSLDFYVDSQSTAPTYARFMYTLRRNNLNTIYSGFRSTGCLMTTTGSEAGQTASAVIDYTVPSTTVRSGVGFIKRLDNFTALPANALVDKFKSQYNEASFVADINNPSSAFIGLTDITKAIQLQLRSPGRDASGTPFQTVLGLDASSAVSEGTMYLQYYRLLTDVHTAFTQQDLVATEGYAAPDEGTATFEGGDSFMCYMSYITGAPRFANPEEQDASFADNFTTGVRIWRGYIGYSRRNFNYRYQTQGNLGSYYHGKTDPRQMFTPVVNGVLSHRDYVTLVDLSEALNVVQYDQSMNTSNEFNVGVIYNPDLIEATTFPNTIIWSTTQSEESKEFSWRSFPSGNRYVIPKNKGDITNLQGWRNRELLIHTKYSLYRTRTDAALTSDSESVFLKSKGAFDLPPEELTTNSSGYAGTQNKMGCALTKVGYAFPDDLRGKVFLYTGDGLEEISSNGMRMFFRDFMGINEDNDDNPFTSNGYTISFDDKQNRLIVTKSHGELSWTVSYNPIKKSWISFHDYIPGYMFTVLGGKLYSTKDDLFYAHNEGAKGTFYEGIVYPSFIDLTFTGDKQDQLFKSVSWMTELYPNTITSGQHDSTLDYSNTLTHLTLRGADHCTGRIPLIPLINFDSYNESNLRNLNRTWYFDNIRDLVIAQGFLLGFYSNYTIDPTKLNTNMEWYDQRKFVDKYLTCRFEYDNTVEKRVLFLEANADSIYAVR